MFPFFIPVSFVKSSNNRYAYKLIGMIVGHLHILRGGGLTSESAGQRSRSHY